MSKESVWGRRAPILFRRSFIIPCWILDIHELTKRQRTWTTLNTARAVNPVPSVEQHHTTATWRPC